MLARFYQARSFVDVSFYSKTQLCESQRMVMICVQETCLYVESQGVLLVSFIGLKFTLENPWYLAVVWK